MKMKQEYRIGIGTSTMLLVFVIISIVTLGVLSFLSAKVDKALTDKNVDMVQGYYAASAAAQYQLLALDNDLTAITNMQELDAYAQEAGMTLADETLRFSVDADNQRMLNVAVSIDEQFQIRHIMQYNMENKEEWSSGFSELPVFDEVVNDESD